MKIKNKTLYLILNIVKNLLALTIIIAVFCLILPGTAEAAIEVDTVSTGTGTSSPITVSHTTGSGANRLMLVGIGSHTTGVAISGVTYDGDSLSLVGTVTYPSYRVMWIYSLVAPNTGTHNVVVTFSTAPSSGGIVGVMTFTGVDQTTPLGTFASATGDNITPSVNVSSATGELVFDTGIYYGPRTMTVGAGQTERWNLQETNARSGGSTEPGAASVTMSWDLNEADPWAIGAVPIKPSASQVYYSVGTSTADLKNAANVTVSSGTATFTAGQSDSVGVGDVIGYQTSGVLSKGSPTTATAFETQTLTIPNHTVSGSNTLLLVGIGWENEDYETISSVYWNGTEQLTEVVYANQDDDAASAIYKLVNPTATTANIVVTFSINLSHYAAAGAITFTGVDQNTPVGSPVSDITDNAGPSLSVPSDNGDIVFGVTSVEDRTITGVGSGQTDEWTFNNLANAPSTGGTSKDGVATSTTISWTYSGDDHSAAVGVAVKPASGTSSQYVYISGRTSSTVYSVITAIGGTPADVSSATVNSIKRVFNSLSDAEINSPGLSYLNTSDLVTGNYQLNWVCYNDAEMTNTVTIYGYTTGADNYIKIYTPVDTSEVGTSQRHNGTAWTTSGFRVSGTPGENNALIEIREDYVRVEGLQVRVTTANNYIDGIGVRCNYVNDISDVRISHNIVTAQASTGDEAAGIGVWSTSSGGNDPTAKIWNNIVYNFDGNGNYGIYMGYDSYPTVYAYNNTVSDNTIGLRRDTGGTIVAKNNASLGNGDNYSGTFDATSTNNASSGTDAPGSNPLNSVTAANNFVSTTSGSEDFHLKSGADCIGAGADLDEDPNIAVTDDIDGDSRDSSTPDIGTDEYVLITKTVYYSIGTSTDDLKNSSNISISSGTATFTVGQPANVGVGDVITYDTDKEVYISGRTSSTVYSVITEKGATPANGSGAVVSIKRVFNSLSAAESGSSGSSYLNTSDLTSGYQLNWVCYADGDMSNTVTINGYTTGPDNYIKIYTPVSSSEVGTSQRHDGTWDSGFVIQGTNSHIITIQDEYVRVEGLRIQLTNASGGGDEHYAVNCDQGGTSEVRISHNIIKGVVIDGDYIAGIEDFEASSGATTKAHNNIIYGFDGSNGWAIGTEQTFYAYSNTIYGCNVGIDSDGTTYAKNNAALGNSDNYSGSFDGASTDNASSGTDAPGSNPLNSVTAANNFVSTTSGSEDFHLKSGADCIEEGADLDEDPVIPITDDIDGESRDSSTPDIGADEYISPPPATTTNYRSIGTNTGTLYNTGNASISSGTKIVTFAGGASLPVPTAVGAVGQGDVLTLDPGGGNEEVFYILSRDGATQVTVQTAATAGHSGESYTIKRAYNVIQTWENARDGNLVASDFIEVGVCYDDGDFSAGAEFADAAVDSNHYMHLTVAEGQRHNGTAGDGVVVDGGGPTEATEPLFKVQNEYTRIEWLQIKNFRGTTNDMQPIKVVESDGANSYVAYLVVYDYTSNEKGINLYEDCTIRNSIIYDGDVGVRTYSNTSQTATLENLTIYGMTKNGVYHRAGTMVIKNVITVGSTEYDFRADAGTTVDPSSGYNLYSTHYDVYPPGTNNQSPPANLDDLFVSISSGSEDLHIESSGHNALDNGLDLSGSFTDDIDGETRSGAWDIGADEYIVVQDHPTTPTLIRIFDNAIFNAYPSYKCTLSVVSTDPEENDIEYEIQWDTDPDFGSASSNTIGPYTSGETVTTTILLGGTPAEAETLFYWKARARDPLGSNTWSSWSEKRSFTMDMEIENEYPYWYQVAGVQFEQDTENGVTVQGDSVVFSGTGASISETGSATNTGSSSAVSITHLLTINAGDVVIAIVHSNSNPTITDNNGANSFIEQLEEANPGQSSQYAIYYRVAGASEPSDYAWTLSGSQSWSIQIRVFSGVDNSSVWDVTPSASTRGYGVGATATAPTMTTSNAGAMGIVALVSDGSDVNFNNPSNGYGTEVEPASSRAQASYIREWATAGSTGQTTVALTDNDWLAHQFALKPATTTEGTLTSPAVVYTDLTAENPSRSHWDGAKWMKSSTADSIGLQIEFKSGGAWSLVPDGDLPNNSTGIFDQNNAFCTINLSSLSTTTYDSLRMKAIFRSYTAKSASVPALEMWALGNLGGVTGVSPTNNPTVFALSRNQPNPFINRTEIRYQIPKRVKVNLQVFDIMGREVVVLVKKEQKPGYYSIQWSGTDKNGRWLPAGVYFLSMKAGDFDATQKMVRLR